MDVNSLVLKEKIAMKEAKIKENNIRRKQEQFRLALKRFIRKAQSNVSFGLSNDNHLESLVI